MARDSRMDSSSSSHRSLHWAPLRSWNLFSGRTFSSRTRSCVPPTPPPTRLPHSRSPRNCGGEGRRAARGSGHSRSNERARKGHRDREESHRQGSLLVNDEPSTLPLGMMMAGNESVSRRRAQGRASETSDNVSVSHAGRPSATIAHHQQNHLQHQHHDHNHHHYHYHHLYHQPQRQLNEHQDQGTTTMSAISTGADALSLSGARNADQLWPSVNRRSSFMNNLHGVSNPRDVAMEARERLDERLRSAALLSHRHSNAGLPGSFLEEFGLVFHDDEDAWSDDEMWELGIQDWLAARGYGEGWHSDFISASEQVSVSTGLSKSMIGDLRKEVFVPNVKKEEEEVGDTSLEQYDCSVCLEHFLPGQLLICLPCKHRFHPDCLTPWLESHGKCPYCRAKVSGEGTGESSSSASASASAALSSSNDDVMAWMGALDVGLARLLIR